MAWVIGSPIKENVPLPRGDIHLLKRITEPYFAVKSLVAEQLSMHKVIS